MKQRLSEQIISYHNAHARKKRWKRLVMVLSCIVVFCTTYALILPAITMTQEPDCGQEAHSHEDACYETIIECSNLHCPQPEHSHDNACYDAEGKLICGYSDFVIHQHDMNCFSKSGELICELPEIQEHAHTEACYETRTEFLCGADALEGHQHSEQCYEQGPVLSCQQEESEDHSHGESCYTAENELVCGKDEVEPHSHTEACEKAQQRLLCIQKEAIPHEHTADCYSNSMLVCGMMQTLCHQHSEGCFASFEEKKNLICGKDEHVHEPACYGAVDSPEAAYHCGMGEHLHKEECYDENHALTCSIPEHTHTEECMENTPSFTCGLSEHTHTEMCKDAQGTLICRLEEHTHNPFCVAKRGAPPMPERGNNFTYEDHSSGLSATLVLQDGNTNYAPDQYHLRIDRQNPDDYANALRSFTAHGHEIAEAAIYKISLVRNDNGQSFTHLNSGYTLEMQWQSGLFTEVNPSDNLIFAYCRNPKNEPIELPDCQVTYDGGGNVSSLNTSGNYYPSSGEFLFVRSIAPNGLIAGRYSLTYNDVRDRFMLDPEYSRYYNASSPLGTAGSFHIVAFNEARLSAHTNGNVLASALYAYSNFGTNNFPDELSYVQDYRHVSHTNAASDNHVLAIGSGNTIGFVDNGNAFSINGTKNDKPTKLLQDVNTVERPFIDLNRVKAEISQIAATLNSFHAANLSYQSAQELHTDYSKLTLRTPAGVGVASYSASELASTLGGYVQIDGFRTGYNGTVIINVNCAGASVINMPQARVVIDGQLQSTSEVTEFYTGKVIWNFVNANGVTINTHLMTGAVIAPGATVNINHNLNSTVVADNINVRAESHRTDFVGKITEPEEEPEPSEYHISVRMTETGYAGTALQGAEFDLYQWKNNAWSKVNQAPLITGANGMVKLQPLEASVAYKLVETKAPPHYVLKDNAAFFWLRVDGNQTAPNSKPDGFVGKAVEIGGSILISNDKAEELYTSIAVKKLWKTEEGTDLPSVPVETIAVKVYQIPDGNEEAKVEWTQLSLSAANGWEAVLSNLPTTGEDANGNSVTFDYSVEEISVSGFETSCERVENLFTITNTRKQQEYTLPETGGAGKYLFTTGGVLFLMASLLLGCCQSRKREGGAGSLQP